jgi:hypothetical protein
MTVNNRRELCIERAIREGKFSRKRAEFYRQAFDRDPDGTEQVIAEMAGGDPKLLADPADATVSEDEMVALFGQRGRVSQPEPTR